MKYTEFFRKILLPHESLTSYFWAGLIGGAGKALLGAGVSAAAGYYLGGGKEANEAMDQSADATQQQSDIAGQQWQHYQQVYAPLEQELVEKVRQGINPDIAGVTGRAAADVTQSYDTTRESTNRTLGRYGINPNSGRFVGTNRQLDIAQAGDKAGAVNRARTDEIRRADDLEFGRMASVVNAGRGIPSSVSANMSNVSNQYANQANTHGQSAASTSEFISALPWNDLFSGSGGGGGKATTSTPGINPAIPSNEI